MERDKRKKLFFLIALCIFIVGCAAWSKVGGLYSNTSALYQVDLPWGWMRYGGKDLLITRDGVFLEDITIKRTNVNEKLAHTKKKYLKGMLA